MKVNVNYKTANCAKTVCRSVLCDEGENILAQQGWTHPAVISPSLIIYPSSGLKEKKPAFLFHIIF